MTTPEPPTRVTHPDSSFVLERLLQAPSSDDRAAIARLHAEIERQTTALAEHAISPSAAHALTVARVQSSTTMRPGGGILFAKNRELTLEQSREAWLKANERVTAWVRDVVPLSLDGLCRLNAILLGGDEPSALRSRPLFLAGEPCLPPEDVEHLLAPMLETVTERVVRDGPLFGGGLLYQWIVSVHPFADGNGRTARLAVDALLGEHGLVPVSFDDPFAAFVAIHPGRSDDNTRRLVHAAEVVGRGVLNTLRILSVAA